MSKGQVSWIKIAKNASQSWMHALEQDGWVTEDIRRYDGRWNERVWFGLLRDPVYRHTVGVAHYLFYHKLGSLLKNKKFSSLLCSGVFDEHSYSVHHLIPHELITQAHWFIIDQENYDYVELVRNLCSKFDVSIPDTIPIENEGANKAVNFREVIDEIKEKNPDLRYRLEKNFLQRDIDLYWKWSAMQYLYDTYHIDHHLYGYSAGEDMIKKFFKDITGITASEEKEREERLLQEAKDRAKKNRRDARLRKAQMEKEREEAEREEAERERMEKEREEAERLKKENPKEIATKNNLPYINILQMTIDPENIHQGSFELDWNEKFVSNLIRAGYQMKEDDTDADIVDRWFQNVCRHVVLETWEQEQAMNPNRVVRSRDIGDGFTEFS